MGRFPLHRGLLAPGEALLMRRVLWLIAITKHSFRVLQGYHNFESSENELKRLSAKYGVNWHKFGE